MENTVIGKINIILNDKNIVVAEKPQGIPCQPDKTANKDFMTLLSESIGINMADLFLVHRLDRPVGGIMVFAKNKNACAFLSEQIQNRTFKKTYLAVVCGIPKDKAKELSCYILKNQRLNMSKIVNKNTPNAKPALLSYRLIKTVNTNDRDKLSLLEIDLKTGRHHQIRVQLSDIGVPIWGDTKYNNNFKRNGKYVKTALFSNSIEFINPTTKQMEKYLVYPYNIYPFDIFNENQTCSKTDVYINS